MLNKPASSQNASFNRMKQFCQISYEVILEQACLVESGRRVWWTLVSQL